MFILTINWDICYAIFINVILLIVLFIVIGKQLGKKNEKEIEITIDKNNGQSPKGIPAAESAAIAMALNLYYGVHDHESDVITIKNIQNRYSPWSSKIYGIQ